MPENYNTTTMDYYSPLHQAIIIPTDLTSFEDDDNTAKDVAYGGPQHQGELAAHVPLQSSTPNMAQMQASQPHDAVLSSIPANLLYQHRWRMSPSEQTRPRISRSLTDGISKPKAPKALNAKFSSRSASSSASTSGRKLHTRSQQQKPQPHIREDITKILNHVTMTDHERDFLRFWVPMTR
jgi:hypothetical protein